MATSITRVALVDGNRNCLIKNLQQLIDGSSGPLRVETEIENEKEVVYLRERGWGEFLFETLFATDADRANATNHARTEIEHKLGHVLLNSTGRQTATLKQSEGMARRRSSSGAECQVGPGSSNDDSSSADFKAEQDHSSLLDALRERACRRKASQGIGFWCSSEPASEKAGTQSKETDSVMQEPVHELHTVPMGMSVFECSPLAVIADVGILCNAGKGGKLPKYLRQKIRYPSRPPKFFTGPDISLSREARVEIFKNFYMGQMQWIHLSAATAVVAPRPDLWKDGQERQFWVVSEENAEGMILAAQEINACRKNKCPISFLFAVSNPSGKREVELAIQKLANSNRNIGSSIAPARQESCQNARSGRDQSSSPDPNRITNAEEILT